MSITINAKDLRRMFEQVTPHMDDPENWVPVISSIRLESRDGWLYAVASDRYTIAVARCPIVAERSCVGHIPGRLVAAFTALVDAAAECADDVTLTLPPVAAEGMCTLKLSTVGRKQLTVEYEPDDYKTFPDWRKVLYSVLTAQPGQIPLTGFTTRFLARWQHAGEKLIVWQEAGDKPMLLLGDDRFVGLQMPTSAYRDGAKREEIAAAWTAATVPTAVVHGFTYDLDKTWEDRHGDPWTYSGNEMPDGMPLMVIEGIEDDPHPLDRLIDQYGPLYAADL
ncbi:phiSA1p31-related protein [Streptomyces sp. NPDC006655]|uniref:phiSA1p31-related protein n=1 Tax=Streptomyces sp. NPDC006655 TaxID=3156898 RepID=UPI003452BF96